MPCHVNTHYEGEPTVVTGPGWSQGGKVSKTPGDLVAQRPFLRSDLYICKFWHKVELQQLHKSFHGDRLSGHLHSWRMYEKRFVGQFKQAHVAW